MQALVLRSGSLVVDEIAEPVPLAGQVLGRVLACGICGSDLHAAKHLEQLATQGLGNPSPKRASLDATRDVVMGHEFCVEILDLGPGDSAVGASGQTLRPGDRVCSLPVSIASGVVHTLGYSNDFGGGFAERMVLDAALCLTVPTDLPTEFAALTEPLSVGAHAVAKATLLPDSVPLVIGCGPVGLAVIVALKAKGIGPIVAADYSPRRRQLAESLGADIVIDPASGSPYDTWAKACWPEGVDRTDPFLALQGIVAKPNVIFECVGVPGMIKAVAKGAQKGTRIVVVGVCMEPDVFEPFAAINKELEFQFVLGYTGDEFAATLQSLVEQRLPGIDLLVTGAVNLDSTPQAFVDLGNPEEHVKILVTP